METGRRRRQDVSPRGKLPATTIPVDNGIALGDVSVDLKNVEAPAQCKLIVAINSGQRAKFENDWDVWVYPAQPPRRPPAFSSRRASTKRRKPRLQAGGKVLLTIPGDKVRNFDTAPVALGFSSIFWNTAWTGRQAPTTLGILCDPKHSGAGRISDRILQQLAMVVFDSPRGRAAAGPLAG